MTTGEKRREICDWWRRIGIQDGDPAWETSCETEERFIAAQADAFAGSEREEKGVGLFRSE
jgi:hypothetical protein